MKVSASLGGRGLYRVLLPPMMALPLLMVALHAATLGAHAAAEAAWRGEADTGMSSSDSSHHHSSMRSLSQAEEAGTGASQQDAVTALMASTSSSEEGGGSTEDAHSTEYNWRIPP
eukprot:CAMPEP_0202870282 /NCGR_PEP_ID=MMETSP1391-20130828/15228_1 /ASSEMBLY_ACC=CAM_ASM_000867 /TAXON_ID=1034604 /ORGANISM="Chlamydomonas leiostraca, Strain SAG 11-49" /LENGTH=115 /DNA_ID=CAMNT_0049550809 /DNA_START=134 /DNA_END=478 /DNA_ORIENTATION=+